MKTVLLTAILSLTISSVSVNAYSAESKAGSEICFNDSRKGGKDIQSKAKEVKANTSTNAISE